jgi:hypothetical protein
VGIRSQEIIKALLFSTSESVSIKDIQKVVQRYHAQAAAEKQPDLLEATGEPTVLPAGPPVQEVIQDIIDQVPTLLTATQIREAVDALEAEMRAPMMPAASCRDRKVSASSSPRLRRLGRSPPRRTPSAAPQSRLARDALHRRLPPAGDPQQCVAKLLCTCSWFTFILLKKSAIMCNINTYRSHTRLSSGDYISICP